MIASLYASLAALLMIWLALKVIKARRKARVSLGDGGDETLRVRIAAQRNAAEYIPIALILMFALEFSDAHAMIVHAFGIAFLSGRVIHARAMLLDDIPLRVRGMKLTIWSIIGLAFFNISLILWHQGVANFH
ncbi:MAG: MAPEG family protein [Pseudomonadota bacterium]